MTTPEHKDDDGGTTRPTLNLENARVLRYDDMLEDTREMYEAYIKKRTEAGHLSRMIDEIEAGNLFE